MKTWTLRGLMLARERGKGHVLDGTEGQSVQVQGYVLLSFLWFTLHSGEKPPPRP